MKPTTISINLKFKDSSKLDASFVVDDGTYERIKAHLKNLFEEMAYGAPHYFNLSAPLDTKEPEAWTYNLPQKT